MIEIPTIAQDIVLLGVRLILAATFFNEAKHKFSDIQAFSTGHKVPLPLAYFIATAEFLAAVSMLTGLLAPLAGIGLILLMLGTLRLHFFRWHSIYWAQKGGWEYDLILLTFGAVIAVFGGGMFSVTYFF